MSRKFHLIIPCMMLLSYSAAYGFQYTEVRPPCANADYAHKQVFFGDLHDHTSYSVDAFNFSVRNDPVSAYAFARGFQVQLVPDPQGNPRYAQLSRPLDFAAVTDHAEGFGPVGVCMNPTDVPGYYSPECEVLRGGLSTDPKQNPPLPQQVSRVALLALIGTVSGPVGLNAPMCDNPLVPCASEALSIWGKTQSATEEAYDRTASCSFTSFTAYEWTAMPGTANLHRNVIFRNNRVPSAPISYLDTGSFDPVTLWHALQDKCLNMDGGKLTTTTGCDVLTIPHNSNMSAGMMFEDPPDADYAALRAQFEPLVEVMQHKGQSECSFDTRFGLGVDTTDEQCAFELVPIVTLLPVNTPQPPPQAFPARSFIRNVLKAGLALGQKLGINPFKYGLIGSTDTHSATPGNTAERTWPGHVGSNDASAAMRVGDGVAARFNPGGLAAVWAEENSRDSLFEALRRKETYATSGIRPDVRFFGGWGSSFPANICDADQDLPKTGYAKGVPMGSDLPAASTGLAPQFVVRAFKDPQSAPLQRIQIVKGWFDEAGKTHEKVYDVAGKAGNNATVDQATCTPQVDAALETDSLCAVWSDPDFKPSQPAFYYERVLENPTCRWSTYDCKSLGVDPFSPTCTQDALTKVPGTNLSACCTNKTAPDPTTHPTIQERAWTSPIWYKPSS